MKFVNYSSESVFKPFQKFRTKSFENNRDNWVTYRTNHISRMSAQQTVKRIAKKNVYTQSKNMLILFAWVRHEYQFFRIWKQLRSDKCTCQAVAENAKFDFLFFFLFLPQILHISQEGRG